MVLEYEGYSSCRLFHAGEAFQASKVGMSRVSSSYDSDAGYHLSVKIMQEKDQPASGVASL